MKLEIRKLDKSEPVPFDLLYLADPSKEAVNDYLNRGTCYIGLSNDKIIGVYVLLPTRPFTIELVNLAVDEAFHNKGLGRKLVDHAITVARDGNYQVLEVGTGNAGIGQMALYQKCGFSIVHVDFDFFRKHYDEPIFENGIECRHMIRLSMDL
ncbi:MAG: GNAT family N-acetyltransferase [Dysgonomonas sp.]|jgi:ribosomal protein S18 acetylase RimI-like enzyme|nr:GNAT family N-acetyltransferase [Prevotella sp.]